ncbi:MAG: Eco57I restriction-modification methylase domain-containing protein [Candidatus Sericytochromatia bacterium]
MTTSPDYYWKKAHAEHQTWISYLQPSGLVVSAKALADAMVPFHREGVPEAQDTLALLLDRVASEGRFDWQAAFETVLNWREGMFCVDDLDALAELLPEYHEELRPTAYVPSKEPGVKARLLIQVHPADTDFNADLFEPGGWETSPRVKFERLLRSNKVPAGLLLNDEKLRLVIAPEGETSGYMDFHLEDMTTVAGRPILSGLFALLGYEGVMLPGERSLHALLAESRKYQSDVSNKLGDQVYEALAALLSGFQQADAHEKGALLGDLESPERREHVYGGLLTTLLRLVFLLYAEERELMPTSGPYPEHYAVSSLHAQLREDAGRYPETMGHRFGAWARLLATFRLVYEGSDHPHFRMPPRHGRLFDPTIYPFLAGSAGRPPRVSDGVILQVLNKLLLLRNESGETERLSYRALDVEQLGAVYESMMGFEVQRAAGESLPLAMSVKKHRLVVVANVTALLAQPSAKRGEWLKREVGFKPSPKVLAAIKAAETFDEAEEALRNAVPAGLGRLAPGDLFLQPTPKRRQTGSHYTPASLTREVVATTLAPVLESLGAKPTADRILNLKICDPAMGSGAFLVQACRYLADEVVAAWTAHGQQPKLPPGEDPILYARRLVAQRCLYGVDANPYAIDLAKLGLWLATLAREHPFTFLDHALRHGDALVGLNEDQVSNFSYEHKNRTLYVREEVTRALEEARAQRLKIRDLARDEEASAEKDEALRLADYATYLVKAAADDLIGIFFANPKPKDREAARVDAAVNWTVALKAGQVPESRPPLPLKPFHWFLEFPEVFADGGFDAFVGNPPFMGKNTLIDSHVPHYLDWLQFLHPGSHGNSDLVAHFFRRAYTLLRAGRTFGLIATNTIGQGDTKNTGLLPIIQSGGCIYAARKRMPWPGDAAVVVSVVYVAKEKIVAPSRLNAQDVPRISAFLNPNDIDEDPSTLKDFEQIAFQGSIVLGMGFTFDDTNEKATPIAQMEYLLASNPRNQEVIFPYIGGEELNDHPEHLHRRYVINFGDRTEAEAREWPELMAIVEAKVKPDRLKLGRDKYVRLWWQHGEIRHGMEKAIADADLSRVLALSRVSSHHVATFLPTGMVYAETLILIIRDTHAALAAVQTRVHELWARFFGSSLEERARYTPSSCFVTFPFPANWDTCPVLEAAGTAYHAHRATLMKANDQGLTATYNRFHDPDDHDPGIIRLRELHDDLDRAMFKAYGWNDLLVEPAFFSLYDEPEDAEATGKRKKQAFRYRWPDAVQDEVFARLLALNAERAKPKGKEGQQALKLW